MIGQTFSKIGKKTGGEEFLSFAEGKDLILSSNMKMFLEKAKKHFKNKKFVHLIKYMEYFNEMY